MMHVPYGHGNHDAGVTRLAKVKTDVLTRANSPRLSFASLAPVPPKRETLMNRLTALCSAALLTLTPSFSRAHFMLTYTDSPFVARPGEVPALLTFWHPFENGHVMDLETPNAFYMIHKGARTDLMDRLEPTTFTGGENTGAAFNTTIPVRSSGDYVIITEPKPYLEEAEDAYIQQFTKVILNRNTLPTDWDMDADLPAEILPLTRPYTLFAGSTFTGQVVSHGEPVAGVEIEVGYMAATPNMDTGQSTPMTAQPHKGGTLVLVSDENGYFTFGVPKAGYWGFAALGAGPETEYNGKELSQDAVFWIYASDME